MKQFCVLVMLMSLVFAGCAPVVPTSDLQQPDQLQQVEDKIQNAMGGGPLLVAQNATIVDWPAEPEDDFTVLRQGTNAWTCIVDDPATPTDDPWCVDDRWIQWTKAFMTGADPQLNTLGIGYMLQGGSSASNSDPYVMEPPDGEDWKIGPPHIMVVSPDKLDPAAFATDPSEGGAWIMWEGTPYEHLMIPVKVGAE